MTPAVFPSVSAFETFGKDSSLFKLEFLGIEVIAVLDSVGLLAHHDLKWVQWLLWLGLGFLGEGKQSLLLGFWSAKILLGRFGSSLGLRLMLLLDLFILQFHILIFIFLIPIIILPLGQFIPFPPDNLTDDIILPSLIKIPPGLHLTHQFLFLPLKLVIKRIKLEIRHVQFLLLLWWGMLSERFDHFLCVLEVSALV
jgi:hypothetical protein